VSRHSPATEGVELIGPGGLLTGLTKTVAETALEAEISEHLGHDKHDPAGRNGENSRNGGRARTVLTEVGPAEVAVPRVRDGSFTPAIVRKRQREVASAGPEPTAHQTMARSFVVHTTADHRAVAVPRPGPPRRKITNCVQNLATKDR
jgi:Transposase, Mutator family